MLNAFPIFKKDFKQLMIFLAGALGIEIIITALWFRILWFYHDLTNYAYYDGFPIFQAIYCVILVMAFAGHWWAEERAGGNDRFLRRLSTSMRRVHGEKMAASLIAYGILFLTQIFLLLFLEQKTSKVLEGRGLQEIIFLWLGYAASAYMIGLVLSRWMSHLLYVVAVGCTIHIAGAGLIIYVRKYGIGSLYDPNSLIFLCLYIVLTSLSIVVWFAATGRRMPQKWYPLDRYKRQCIAAAGIAFLLILISVSVNVFKMSLDIKQIIGGIASLASVFLSVILGVSIYDPAEKQIGHNILHHHPLSRSRLYWSRLAFGVPVIVLTTINMAIVTEPRTGFDLQALALILSFVTLPFFAGLLSTHAFWRPIYAAFATGCASLVTFLYFYLPMWFTGAYFYSASGILIQIQRTNRSIVTLSELLTLAAMLATGFSLAGWKCATDRTLLAGSDWHRLLYVLRLLLFVLALCLFIFFTGFRDLFYLITNIDLGLG